MSLSAQDIVALARAGYNAEQISMLNRESTQSTESTESPVSTEMSTPSTQEEPAAPAPKQSDKTEARQDPAPAAQEAPAAPAGPQVADLMAKLEELQTRLTGMIINNDQQPGQQDQLTGEKVLAQILDPRIK